ncbi:MAG: hypothetical protein WBV79_08720 [Rhodomicrobium sp.]
MLNLSFPRTCSSFCGVTSMWRKFFIGLVFGLLGSVAVASLLLTVHEQRKDLRSVSRDYSSHIFSNLTAKEINRQTLKAAAAIDRSHKGRTQGRRAELKVPLTKQVMETDAGQIALFEYRHGALPATLDEVATSTHESVKFSMRDPWNDKLKYVPHNNGHFQLVSAGPDKVFGTSDDIQETF